MHIDFLAIVQQAWDAYAPDRPIRDIVDVSVNVSTNHVYRVDLVNGDTRFAKVSYFGTYRHFREDHTIIHALGSALPPPYEDFLARACVRDGRVHTHRHQRQGLDMWVVFYHPVALGQRLPRQLEAQHIQDLGVELARFHRVCHDVKPDLPQHSKTTRYDIEALMQTLKSDQGRYEFGWYRDFIWRQCQTYLGTLDENGFDQLPTIPVFVDWNIGNFSLSADRRFFSRWDYDWFRVSSRVLDFYFFSRVVSSAGDQTVFSYVVDTFLEDRFLDFLRAYHDEFPLTEAELWYLPQAYRFFLLNYVVKYGQHFFHDIYGTRLQREAFETYLPQVERLDVPRLLRALDL